MEVVSVNNYEAKRYSDNEIVIQTTPKQLEANEGRVYLRSGDLKDLLVLAETGAWEPSTNFHYVVSYSTYGEGKLHTIRGDKRQRLAPHEVWFHAIQYGRKHDYGGVNQIVEMVSFCVGIVPHPNTTPDS